MISPLSPADLPRILEIERAAYPTPWSEALFMEEFTNSLGISCGWRPERLEGYIFAWQIFEDLHINNVAVDPAWRRRGITRRLLEEVMARARANGGEFISLEVREKNLPAQELYRSLGFKQVAVRKGYYSDTGEDGLVLGRKLA